MQAASCAVGVQAVAALGVCPTFFPVNPIRVSEMSPSGRPEQQLFCYQTVFVQGGGNVPEHVRVTPEDLQVSAGTVDTHADNVRAQHFAADSRMEAAQPGLPMGSAAALGAAVTKWQADTTTMFGRMIDHAHGLRTGAVKYIEADQSAGTDINQADQQIRDIDLGL